MNAVHVDHFHLLHLGGGDLCEELVGDLLIGRQEHSPVSGSMTSSGPRGPQGPRGQWDLVDARSLHLLDCQAGDLGAFLDDLFTARLVRERKGCLVPISTSETLRVKPSFLILISSMG